MTATARARRSDRRSLRDGEAPSARRTIRWGALAGTVTFLYVVFFAIEIAVAGLSPRVYNRLHQIQGNAFSRLVLALVVLAAIFHGLNGLRVTVCDMAPKLNAHEQGMRFAVQFLTFAVGIPAAFVVLWPSISELIR